MLQMNRKMCETFQVHFCDHFAHCSDLPVQELCNYLAGFRRLWEAKAASCEGVVTECEVCDVLKQIDLNESPGLDG